MFSWRRSFFGMRRRQLFNAYLLVGSVGIVLAITLFTVQLTRRVESQSLLTTSLLSSRFSRLLGGAADQSDVSELRDVMAQLEFPVVVTDPGGLPILWNEGALGVPIPSLEVLLGQDPAAPTHSGVARVIAAVHEFDAKQEPFAIKNPTTEQLLGTLHYGSSALTRRVRLLPWLELVLIAVFFGFVVWALGEKKIGEQQRLFAGMARETAHQLGTPLTSIMGWTAILRERVGEDDEVMDDLDRDVERLGKISTRFSQIGSSPQLVEGDLGEVVDDTIVYFRRRLPHLGGRVNLRAENTAGKHCRFNRDLLEWVLENLIKNGMDALTDGKGTITVRLSDAPAGGVVIRVSDTGAGIAPHIRNKIFEPGLTTKKRGWGMGLALVKRIVTEYHRGRIQVETTGPRGTTFAVHLPGEEPRRGL